MIKLFRKIRQSLLTKNKTGQYLKYAIGEIILVVIGILIAISLNNWNEERKTELKSGSYKEKIISDLVSDTIRVNDLIARSRKMQEGIKLYFAYFEHGNNSISQLIDSSRNVQWSYFRYLPINHTYLELKSSGNIELLKEGQRELLLKLSLQQEFLQFIIDARINDIKFISRERNKYLDFDSSIKNFFEITGALQTDASKLSGLLQQHYIFTEVLAYTGTMINMGASIKVDTKRCIELLKN